MSNFIKVTFSVILLIAAGFLAWKMVGRKIEKPIGDLKKEYRYTCDNLAMIAKALDEDYEVVPSISQAKTLNELQENVKRYAPRCPLKDAWGNDFIYHPIDASNFEIASAGSDGIFNGFDQEGEYPEYSGQDIIVERGQWKYAPQNADY